LPPSLASSTHIGYITSISPHGYPLTKDRPKDEIKPKDLVLIIEGDDSEYKIFKLPIKMPVIKAAIMPIMISAWIILKKYYNLKGNDKVIIDINDTEGESPSIFSRAIVDIGKYMGIHVLNISNKNDQKIIETITVKGESGSGGGIKLGITNSSASARTMTRLLAPNGVVVICDNDIIETTQKINYEKIYFPIAASIFTNIAIVGFSFNQTATIKPDWVQDGINGIEDMMNNNFFQYIESYEEKDFKKGLDFIERTGKSVVLYSSTRDE